MYLLYLDDSGSPQNKNEKNLVIAGVSVFERQLHWLNEKLDALAAEINPSDASIVEFHAAEIFSGRKPPWSGFPQKTDRIAILKKVLSILAEANDEVTAFACIIEKSCYPAFDPVELAFEDISGRFDMYLKRKYAIEGRPERGLIIFDESTYENALQNLTKTFRKRGNRWGNAIRNINEVPLFVDSKASRIIQLADHVAYSVFRRYEVGDSSYLDLILHKFDREDRILHGMAHKQTSNSNCMCPACMSRH